MNNLTPISNAEHLTALVKAIVPRSFEKTFGGLATTEVVAGFRFCTQGLNQAELNIGLDKVRQMGYCPDPALFAKWCKGIDGFDSTDHIADSYISKNGALANILSWLKNHNHQISIAEKQAYDKTAFLFNEMKYNAKIEMTAHSAFKDHYEMIVHELVVNKVKCERYIAPIAITHAPSEPSKQLASDEFVHSLFGLNKMDVLA